MKSYFITDPKYYNNLNSLQYLLHKVYKTHNPNFACFRDKISKNYKSQAKLFSEITKSYGIKALINSNIHLAKLYNFYGVHLTSQDFDKIQEAKKSKLFTIISTHSLKEALKAQKLGVDAITFSPIFHTPNKGKPKGIDELKRVLEKIEVKCFALGGIIDENHIKECKATNCYGFASIRYFLIDKGSLTPSPYV